MTVKIAPSPRQQFEDANGLPYSGAKLFTYVAGSSTKQTTYTTSVGDVANSNPIVLDSAGRTPYGVWLTAGVSYKFVLAPSTDTDPPTSPIFTEDNIAGVNDTTVSTSQWIASGLTPTYIGATQFSVVGDQTTELHVNRRLKLTVSAGTVYGKISVSAYTTVTTVTVVLDSGVLDSGLSSVEWSILSKANDSMPRGIFSELSAANTFSGSNTFSAANTFSGSNIFSAAQTFNHLVTLEAGADIASAATIDLTAATGNSPRITGTTPTSAVTMNTGQTVRVVADEAWPLVYHATTNKLNTGGLGYTCAAGDIIEYHKDLSGVVHGVIQNFAGLPVSHDTIYTTGGTSTAYTLTTTNPRASLAVGQRFKVKFHTANGAAPTINIDGLGATQLVRENVDGALSALVGHTALAPCIATNHYTEIEVLSGSQIRVVSLPPRVFSGTLTRDLTAASGDVAQTGIGFAPRKITFYSKITGTIIGSVGFAGGAGYGAGQCVFSSYVATADGYTNSSCIMAYQASSAYQVATCAFGADGFTLTWTKTNSPTGTLGIIYHAEE